MDQLTPSELTLIRKYVTNVDRSVFALRNLPEVVKGALFSRYSRSEKSLRRLLLDEFINAPDSGFQSLVGVQQEDELIAVKNAESFYERVLLGYGDDSVAELAGAHLAVEAVSMLAAKALEDSRIGISPLEKSTRYVRFDRLDSQNHYSFYRGPELANRSYEVAMDGLFASYSQLIDPVIEGIRASFPIEPGENERGWKSATRAKALDLLRGLLPAGTLTNLGLYGNGRAFEYLITKMSAHELAECRRLAEPMHAELSLVIPAFVRRALDDRHGAPAARRLAAARERAKRLAPAGATPQAGPSLRLTHFDRDAERRVVAAALFPHGRSSLESLEAARTGPAQVLDAMMSERANRRDRAPRALEHASYTFEMVANFAAYRDLQRHRMLTQDRQILATDLGYDHPHALSRFGLAERFEQAVETASRSHEQLRQAVGPELAQYGVPMAFRVRWYVRTNLREIYHLCELRTSPQGHPDYRFLAQEMFRRVQEVHPRLARYARFVDLGPGDELERRKSERRIDARLAALT